MTASPLLATAMAAAVLAVGAAGATATAHACGWPQTCDPQLPSVDSGGASSGSGGSVTGSCTGVAGVAIGTDRATYIVHASATAATTNPGAAPVGTGVTCRVVDGRTGAVYGTVRGGQPGPTAHAVGAVTVPNGVPIRVCVDSNAVFSDGSTAHDGNCR